jgi:lipid-binding SYLF domain-containing protein
MQRRTVLTAAASAAMALALLGGCANYREPGETPADVQSSIDAGVQPTLTALYAKVPGSKELADKARGILVFPSVFDGSAVAAANYGRGALIVDAAPSATTRRAA